VNCGGGSIGTTMSGGPCTAIESFDEFHAVIEAFGKRAVVFRGVRKDSYPLVPRVGRYDKFTAANIENHERTMLRLFKQQAFPFLTYTPKNNWEWLAIAQHHGLPTRLMDWTHNPLVAAYFAVESAHNGDSVVFAYTHNKFINTAQDPNPFAVNHVARFIPNHITPRITAQAGLFTVHPNPKRPFVSSMISKIVIKQKFRRDLKYILYKYGIHRATMFPGLDGLANHITWRRTDEY